MGASAPEISEELVSDQELVREKLLDASEGRAGVEFAPDEADLAGAFPEDALSEADARESAMDGVE